MYKDIEIIKSEIKYLLEALHDQLESIDSQGDVIMQIDVDLFKNYVVNLYDATLRLKNYNIKDEKSLSKSEIPPSEPKQEVEEEIQPIRFSIIQEPEIEVVSSDTPLEEISSQEEIIPEIIAPAIETIVEEEIVVEMPKVKEIEEVIIEKVEEAPPVAEVIPQKIEAAPPIAEVIPEKTEVVPPKSEVITPKQETIPPKPKVVKSTLDLFADESQTLADKFKTEKKVLNEKLHTEQKNLAGNIPKKPVNDLKQAIGINEKFNFINELFRGSLQDYNLAINELNNATNWDEAENILNTLLLKFGWENNNDAFPKLYDIVNRKFL
ncbi:MAG: hypothetical protein WCH34_01140 [Bacteroidota bacterium]